MWMGYNLWVVWENCWNLKVVGFNDLVLVNYLFNVIDEIYEIIR